MKTTALLLLCFVFTANFCSGQNLVPNPSFEEYDTCPVDFDYVENAIGWVSTRSSPNYFNSCSPFVNNNSASVPCNGFGCQYPASGNCYMGFYAKTESSGYREYLGTPLISDLQIGTRYYVSLKVNLTPYSYTSNYCGVNKIGILFSTEHYSDNFPAPENNYAQVYTQDVITDTANWVLIKGTFVADSSYSFISIGNFFSDSLTDSIQISGTSCHAYYLLDDVCVSTDSIYCYNYSYTNLSKTATSNVLIYPNPATDFLNIDLTELGEACSIILTDALGNKVIHRYSQGRDIEHFSVENIPAGIYFCAVICKNKTLNFKALKSKI